MLKLQHGPVGVDHQLHALRVRRLLSLLVNSTERESTGCEAFQDLILQFAFDSHLFPRAHVIGEDTLGQVELFDGHPQRTEVGFLIHTLVA